MIRKKLPSGYYRIEIGALNGNHLHYVVGCRCF